MKSRAIWLVAPSIAIRILWCRPATRGGSDRCDTAFRTLRFGEEGSDAMMKVLSSQSVTGHEIGIASANLGEPILDAETNHASPSMLRHVLGDQGAQAAVNGMLLHD